MDGQIRRIESTSGSAQATGPAPTLPGSRPRAKTVVKRIEGKLVRVPADPSYATVSTLRKAILDCAHQATTAEPVDTDRRLHSFLAKLSATMEHLGERELDAVLWNLMETKPAGQQVRA